MTLKELVPSLELCKELKENGYPQDTIFHYVNLNGEWVLPVTLEGGFEWTKGVEGKTIASPTASEIGEQLPTSVNGLPFKIQRSDADGMYFVTYATPMDVVETFGRHSLAEVLGRMWLYLKKKQLLKGE